MTTKSHVTCVMPTTARRRWCIPWAIEYFLRQSYTDTDLLIVGDGESVEDLIPDHPRVRYLHLDETPDLGRKFNICCDEAEGPWIALWADDDWQASWRLTYSMATLFENPGRQICGKQKSLIHNLTQDQTYIYENHDRWFGSGSAIFTKAFWQKHKFQDTRKRGVDTIWLQGFSGNDWRNRVLILTGWLFYVAMDHSNNTGRSIANYSDTHYTKWQGNIRELLGADWARYEAMRGE